MIAHEAWGEELEKKAAGDLQFEMKALVNELLLRQYKCIVHRRKLEDWESTEGAGVELEVRWSEVLDPR